MVFQWMCNFPSILFPLMCGHNLYWHNRLLLKLTECWGYSSGGVVCCLLVTTLFKWLYPLQCSKHTWLFVAAFTDNSSSSCLPSTHSLCAPIQHFVIRCTTATSAPLCWLCLVCCWSAMYMDVLLCHKMWGFIFMSFFVLFFKFESKDVYCTVLCWPVSKSE